MRSLVTNLFSHNASVFRCARDNIIYIYYIYIINIITCLLDSRVKDITRVSCCDANALQTQIKCYIH